MSNAIDQAKSDAFAEQIACVVNNKAIALKTSIGHQTHL